MSLEHQTVPEGGFIAWSISGTADYGGAQVQISWGLTVGGKTVDMPKITRSLPMPFVTASPADFLREALYQYAEKL